MPEKYKEFIGIRLNKYNEFVTYAILFKYGSQTKGFRAYTYDEVAEQCTLESLGFNNPPKSWKKIKPIKVSELYYKGLPL